MGQETLRAIGSGLQMGGQIGGALAANRQAQYNASVDRADAVRVMQESRKRAAIIMRQGRSRAAEQKVRAAGSGFTQEGTSLQLQLDEIATAEFNALEEIRVGRAAESRFLESAAYNVQRGKIAKTSGLLGAVGTGVGLFEQAQERKRLKDA